MTALAEDQSTGEQSNSDESALRSLLRLRRWTRPYRRTTIAMIVYASGAMLAQSLVPLVIGAVVDGPIRHHDTTGLWRLAGVAFALGVAEAGFFYARRRAMSTAAIGLETDIRRDLFAHVQRLPVSFHDQWPSGQLLSRLTTDLSTLRRFVGFGFVFLIANSGITIVVLVLLVHIHLWLGLFVLVAMAPLAFLTRRFELRYSRAGPPGAGPHRRPGHLGRGIRARHPRDQVLRPPPAHADQVHPGRAAAARRRARRRSARSAGSGRCSRACPS